jgi:PadR family transcriptional regulator
MLIINRSYFCMVRDSKQEVLPGTLTLLILKTLATLGPLHGYGIARRIEQVSGDLLELNQGTVYPALLKLEQMGWIRTKWSTSENNRRAKFYSLTAAGRKQLVKEEEEWRRTSAIVTRFLSPSET